MKRSSTNLLRRRRPGSLCCKDEGLRMRRICCRCLGEGKQTFVLILLSLVRLDGIFFGFKLFKFFIQIRIVENRFSDDRISGWSGKEVMREGDGD